MGTVFLGVAMFTIIVIALVLLILAAKSQLVASGPVKIMINQQKEIEVTVKAGRDAIEGFLQMTYPNDWSIYPQKQKILLFQLL